MSDLFFPQEASRKAGDRRLFRFDLPRSLGKLKTIVWRALNLGPIVTFATGVVVGLLIPSEDWVAIVAAIVIGAVLQRIVSAIDPT